MASRSLTQNEIALAQSMFGNVFDWNDIVIHDQASDYVPTNRSIHAPFGEIHIPPGSQYHTLYNDLTQGTGLKGVYAKAVFLHEMMHVLQYQQGGDVFGTAFTEHLGGNAYDYVGKLVSGVSFEGFGFEEQGQFIQDYYLLSNLTPQQIALDQYLQGLPHISVYQAAIPTSFLAIQYDKPIPNMFVPGGRPNELCFLSGTSISMWDGSTKPIELIEVGDVVASYDPDEADGRGELKPGRVVRTYRNTAQHILDMHGLKVTPGHVTLCGDGPFAGRHVAIMDILRSDGALVTRDGDLVRASTNCPVGSEGDGFIWAVAGHAEGDGTLTVTDKGRIRLGTRLLLDDGRDCSVLDIIKARGWVITDEGLLKEGPEGSETSPFVWPLGEYLPRPEDYVLARSRLTLNDLYGPGEWEAMAPAMAPAGTPDETTEPGLRVSPSDTPPRTFRGEARH